MKAEEDRHIIIICMGLGLSNQVEPERKREGNQREKQ